MYIRPPKSLKQQYSQELENDDDDDEKEEKLEETPLGNLSFVSIEQKCQFLEALSKQLLKENNPNEDWNSPLNMER